MQKHPEDPASVPSEPTVGDPDSGFDQEIDRGTPRGRPKPSEEKETASRPQPRTDRKRR
jgi:hypothetical protein